ncbi:MAG: hypothetical protein RLZZ468_287 [Cyanobacteriota bacterium]
MQNVRSPYDVAALNNPYVSLSASPITNPAPTPGSALTADQQERLRQALAGLEALSAELNGEPAALLELLRQLEQLHRTLQDGPFRNSLPADRNALFALLQRMEQSGGWPYIPRLQLRTFMDLLQRDRPEDDHPLAA